MTTPPSVRLVSTTWYCVYRDRIIAVDYLVSCPIIPRVELERDQGGWFHGLGGLVHDHSIEREHPAAAIHVGVAVAVTVATLPLPFPFPLSLSLSLSLSFSLRRCIACLACIFRGEHHGLYEGLGSAARQSAAHYLGLEKYVYAVHLQHSTA